MAAIAIPLRKAWSRASSQLLKAAAECPGTRSSSRAVPVPSTTAVRSVDHGDEAVGLGAAGVGAAGVGPLVFVDADHPYPNQAGRAGLAQ